MLKNHLVQKRVLFFFFCVVLNAMKKHLTLCFLAGDNEPQDISCQLEVQTVYCQPMESTVAPNKLHYKYHYLDHPIYIDKLVMKVFVNYNC